MTQHDGVEAILWNDWHVVADLEPLTRDLVFATRLLNVDLTISMDPRTHRVSAHRGSSELRHVKVKYGFVWACLGEPAEPIVEFELCNEAERLMASGGSVRVSVSGLRAVENFLDLAHLAFVHAGFLGEEPHTEIVRYSVEPRVGGGILATGCRVYQPKPSPVDSQGFDVDYVYEVRRPYIVVLYKANPVEKQRMDMIALFVQPVSEECCIAHAFTSYLPHEVHPPSVRAFQQLIFGQDRPILENQLPKRLPLDPRAEYSVRSDASSAAYRRWLSESGVRFGAIPAH